MYRGSRKGLENLLQQARSEADVAKLKLAKEYYEMHAVCCMGRRTDVIGSLASDVLVDIAEVAYELKQCEIGLECVSRYLESKPSESMFYVRCYYAKGLLESLECPSLKGRPLIDRTLLSLQSIRKGMEVAVRKKDKFGFLVYNGTIHIWNVSRYLSFQSVRANLVAVLQDTIKSLDDVQDTHVEWKLRLMLQLGLALVEAGKADEASKLSLTALDLCNKQCGSFKRNVLYGCIEINKSNPAVVTKLKSEATTAPLKLAYSSQVLRSLVLKDRKAAETELNEAVSVALKTLAEPAISSTAKTASDGRNADVWDTCSELLRATIQPGYVFAAQAQQLLDSVLKSSTALRARTSVEAVQAVIPVVELDDFLAEANVNARSSALKKLEKALQSASRSGDRLLVEYCSVWIWNIGMHLLQNNTRNMCYRPFLLAAQELEKVESELHVLRVKLHYEIARCEIVTDTLAKAATQVKTALALDYVVDEATRKAYELDRPYDRYLVPLENVLQLRTNVYKNPDSLEDQLELLLDQVRESKFPNTRKSLLERTLAILESGLEAEKFAISQGRLVQTAEEAKKTRKRRAYVYADMIRSAWVGESMRFPHIVNAVFPLLLAEFDSWDAVQHKELRLDMVRCCYIMADAAVFSLTDEFGGEVGLNDYDFTTIPPNEQPPAVAQAGAAIAEADAELVDPDQAALEQNVRDRVTFVQREVEKFIVQGLEMAVQLADETSVVNGAVAFYNHHLQMIRLTRTLHIEPLMLKVFHALDAVFGVLMNAAGATGAATKDAKDKGKDKAATEKPSAVKPPVSDELIASLIRTGSSVMRLLIKKHCKGKELMAAFETPADSPELKQSLEICEKVKARFAEAGRGTIMQIRDVIALEARTKRLAGVKTADGKGPEETLVAISELLSSPLKKEESEALIKKAQEQTAILTKQGTKLPVEPCVLIAVHCLQLGFPRAALDLATQVVGLLTDTEGVSAKKWRWFGTAERVCGQSLVLQIDPQRLEKRAQDAIRSEALDHLSKACEYLTRSPLLTTAVMLDTLQVFLWAVGPFMASPVTKQLAIPFLQRVCAVASGFFSETKHAVKGLEPGSIILQLFVSMVDALYASMPFAEDPSAVNSESEDWCTKGLLCVPRKLHKKLIEFAVRCASSSSRRKWMSRIKEYDPETQARAWTTVARIADTRVEQREAFLHAIGLMQEPASKAEFLVEYAIWRFFNNFPVREALDTLLYTVDLLTEKDQQADIESAANTPRSDSKSTLSKRSRNTALSRHSGVSRASSKGSKLSVRSSNRSMVMKAIVADIEQDMGLSCVEVELLARTLVSLAVLSESSTEKLHYAKMAVHQYSRLFHTSARFLNQLVDAAARDKTVAAAVGAGQQKLQFPSALSSWIDFSLVPAIMDRLLGSTSLYVLNSRSIRQPQLTIAFLQLLMRLLSSLGYLLHQVPLYTVAIFIAEKLLQDHVLTAVLKSGLLRLLQTLGKASAMPELPAEVAKAHASWELSSKDKRIAIQEVQQFAQISASRSKVTIKDDERKSTVSEAASQASPYIQDVLQPRSVRHTWILEAQELLRCGQWISASGVALEIANHATIFKEYATLSESLRLLGQVQMAENDHDGAVANLRKAMEGARFTVDVWADVLIACADALWLQEKSIHAITCLRDGIRVVAEFASRPLNAIAEAKLALSRLSLHLCRLMFASIKHRLSRPDASMMSDLETIRFYLKTASVNATAYGYCPHMYELVAFTIDFERSLAEGLSSPLERRSALQSLLRSFDAAFVSSCFAVYKDIRCADPMVAIDFPVASLIANVLLDIAEVELQLFCLEQANRVLIERMETPFFPSSTFQQDDTKVREFLKHSMLEDGLPPIVDDTRWERVYHSALSAASLTPSPSVQSRAFLLCGASICWHAFYSLGLQSPSDDLPTDLQEELSRCRQTAGKFLHDCLRISVDHQFWMHASRASVCLSLLDADKAVGFSFQAVGFRSAAEAAEAVASVSHRTSASGVTVPNVARMVANPNSAAFDFDALKSSLPPVLANDVTHVCIIPPFRDQIHVLCGVIHKGQSYIEYVDVDPSRLTSAMNDMTALFDEMVPDALAQGQCIANCASTADEQLMRPILDSLTKRLPAETTDVKPKIRLSLLCPPSLQVLPYELTPSVSSNCSSVIRDFSLAMLVARHQGLSKLTAPRAAASFLIDDRKEAEGLTRMVRTSVVEPSASSITKEWKTVSGETDRLIGASEWMNVLSAPTSRMVLHVGLERLLMLTGARPLLDIDFQHNELFFNVECVSSESSLERRKLYYNTVSAIRRVAQSPIHLALYLSLAGTCNYVTTPAGLSKEDAVGVMQQMLKLAPAEPTLDMPSLLAKSVSASIPDPQQQQQPWFVMFGTTIPGFVTAPEPAPAKGAKK